MKKIITIFLVLVIGIVIFSAGTVIGESGVLDNVFGRMRANVQSNTDSLISQMNNMLVDKVEEALSEAINVQTQRATNEIETYIDQKLNEIESEQNVIDMSIEIMHMTTGLIVEEKYRVDGVIEEILN